MTPSAFRRLAFAIVISLSASTAFAQTVDIKAHGRPQKTPKSAHYEVWHDSEGWHVLSDTAGKGHRFEGTIQVEGGKFFGVSNFESLERAKKGKRPDVGRVSDNKKQITFNFMTGEKADQFSFKVSADATTVKFRLLIDGNPTPERVFIGEGSQPAPGAVFDLPAHPEH